MGSRSTNRFRDDCVSTENDLSPGRPRTSTPGRSVKLVADALEEDRRVVQDVKNFLESREFQQRQYSLF